MTGGQLLGDHPSQCGIASNGPHMNSCDAVEELQVCMSRWYFSRKEIEDYSPSRKDGIEFKKETELRKLYCSFLQDLGIKLKVPQVTIAAAMLLCHRFYLRQSHGKNAWQTMATVSMFLACKVEETPRLLMDVVVVSYEIMYKKNPAAAQRIKQKDVYEKQKELVILGERLLLATIGFDLNIPLPYKPLVAALKKMQISHNDIAKVAWNFLNDWLRTTLCLQYKPHYIAAGSMYLAAKFNKVKLPSERGNVWWLEFDVVPQQLEEVIQQMLGLLEENKRSVTPSSHEKTTQATVPPQTTVPVKNEQSKSSPSFGPSASVITSNSRDAICREDDGGSGSTSSKKGLLQNSQKLPCKDVSVVRKEVLPSQTSDISVVREEVLPSQTSDSGSSHSVVEDGEDRYNEGEVQATIIESNRAVEEDGDHKSPHEGHVQAPSIESNQVASAKIVSVSMGLSKTDQDRIREAIKRRKCERVPNKKVVIKSIDNDDLDDDDSWIVRELENGLEEYASTEKRQRLVY